jgi:hypothetical protein
VTPGERDEVRESGKAHPGNISAMLTIEQATDLRERLTSAMAVDRPAPTPTADSLATVRSALDVASKATTGEWECEQVDVFGTLTEWAALIGPRRPGSDWPRKSDLRHEDAVAIVALRNAAPAIAELCAEVERLRAEVTRLTEAVDVEAESWGVVSAKLDEAKRLGLEACAFVHSAIDNAPDPTSNDPGDQSAIAAGHSVADRIAAALEAL